MFQTWNKVSYEHGQNMVRTRSKYMVRERCRTIVNHVPNMVNHVLNTEHCHQFGGVLSIVSGTKASLNYPLYNFNILDEAQLSWVEFWRKTSLCVLSHFWWTTVEVVIILKAQMRLICVIWDRYRIEQNGDNNVWNVERSGLCEPVDYMSVDAIL